MILLICLLATMIGAATGIGGGVIIKPVMDAVTNLPAATISFMSGCTVLSMASVSLARSRRDFGLLDVRVQTLLAAAAAGGGLLGKLLMNQLSIGLGLVQNTILLVLTLMGLVYMVFKDFIRTRHLSNDLAYLICGLGLGTMSSFLGIGGGPINLIVLMYLFSMDAKKAALSSLYIILLSQLAALVMVVASGTMPTFDTSMLVQMILGGVAGGLIGRSFAKHAETFFYSALGIIIAISSYNIAI